MKLHFTNATGAAWEFTLTDAVGATTIPLPPGHSTHTLTPTNGSWLIYGPAGDGFPHGLSRRFTADESATVAALFAAERVQPGIELHEHIYSDPAPPPEE